jgi:branched-chain amino acid transport system permease protein
MTDFVQTLVNSLAIGSLYALIALGYTMVYGVLKFINFAHSDVFVVGAMVSCTAAVALGFGGGHAVPWWGAFVVLPVAMLACGLLAFVIERFAYRPLRNAPRLNVLITAIGVSLLLQNLGQLQFIFGTQPRPMPRLIDDPTLFRVVDVRIGLIDVIALVCSISLMLGLEYLISRTRLGRAMRATSFNFRNAALMGINVNAVISFTFVLGAVLAAAAGFLFGMKYSTLQQPASAVWLLLGLKAFVAAVVGGIGNIRGAMIGGFLIGALEQFGSLYLSPDLKDVYVFALLILVLLIRPSGIFGSTAVEKV